MNRATGSRLAQAAALFAMRRPNAYPASGFNEAWKNETLYDEHTWGADCSIDKPDDPFTLDLWNVKKNFALDADRQSRALLAAALPQHDGPASRVDVFNTTQWQRTDLAVVPPDLASGDTRGVVDENGKEIPAQRLSSGELVFVAKDVPPFGAKRYHLTSHGAVRPRGAHADGTVLETRSLRVEVNSSNGAVKSLRLSGLDHEFVDSNAAVQLNDFRYVLSTNTARAQTNGAVTISVLDSGPVMATLCIDSPAPGCNHLTRDIRLVEGLGQVELIDRVDRKSVREKDAVHIGFGFDVPGGVIRMEMPWAVVRPNADQMPGFCRNWYPVERWLDVSGKACGITWASLDAPLLEIGAMTANLLGPAATRDWLTNALSSQTIYSWAQNNHWFTNYKIDQPGVTTFRYILRPHKQGYSPAQSARFGLETTRPLLVAAAEGQSIVKPLLTISPSSVLIETVKMSDDGEALILRLFDVSDKKEAIRFTWGSIKPKSTWFTDLTEKPLRKTDGPLQISGHEVLSLRVELL